MNCPLCKGIDIIYLERIDNKYLIRLYKKMLSKDFSYLINSSISYCECQNCNLKFFTPLITGDEKFYNCLQELDFYYMDDKEEFIKAKQYIKQTDKVLEVGSGKGAFAKCIPTKDYVGLDFSLKAKELAAEHGVVIKNEMIQHYAQSHCEEFDVVVSFQVLEHVSDPDSFIQSKVDALKVGGTLIIAVPNEDSFIKYAPNNLLNMPPHHVTRWGEETLFYLTRKYNLELLELYCEPVQEVHKRWFLSVLFQNALLKHKLIDCSFIRKIIHRLGWLFSGIFIRGITNEMLPKGHTISAIYRKLG